MAALRIAEAKRTTMVPGDARVVKESSIAQKSDNEILIEAIARAQSCSEWSALQIA